MKRDFCETFNLLCRQDPEFYRNGAVNSAAVSRAVGIAQATIHRMLEGQSSEPRAGNAKKLCTYFKVTREQLVGDAPIPGIDGNLEEVFLAQANPRLAAAFRRLKDSPLADQEAVLAVIEGLELRRSPR